MVKWQMEVMHEGMNEKKERIERMPVYLRKC